MSVFLFNSENEVVIDSPGSGQSSDGGQPTINETQQSDIHQALNEFWPRTLDEIRRIDHMDVRCQSLPLARIKKIMKLDEDVKMISAEAPVLFAKAAELFIQELTLRAWVHTEDNKRRTLQRNDIAMAISKYDQFDFLIDIVPREEATRATANRSQLSLDQVHYYLQLNQQQGAQATEEEVEETETRQVQVVQQAAAIPQEKTAVVPSGNIQVLQQVVGPNGEISHIPIQIPERQLELIRVQVENGVAPVMLSPQVVQVRQQNPVFIQTLNTQQN